LELKRREFLELLALSAVATGWPAFAQTPQVPRIGMGTWITFNVGDNQKLRDARAEVLNEFFKAGGGMIDSSPMYGSSEAVVGYGLKKLGFPKTLFSATKVWTSSADEGIEQIKNSHNLWGLKKFDLLQIHNLDGWPAHIKTLFKMKSEGKLKYVGITTSHGRRHAEFEKIMRAHPLDFVQLTYNIVDREAEKRLLDVAKERGMAVIANRPLDGGRLFDRVKGKPVPAWAAEELGCRHWSQFFLKFVVSHPAVTCAIPATSKVEHMRENMGAGGGVMPDAAQREKMIKTLASL